MPTPHIHNGLSECPICGLVFPHYHPDNSKPKEWVSLEDGVTTKLPQGNEWWEDKEYLKDHTIREIISEAQRLRDEQWREKLDGMKRTPMNPLESRSLRLKARNEMIEEILKPFI